MARSIVAGAIYRSRWRASGLEVEGPDEDAFTMAGTTAERLLARAGRASGSVGSIDLVGGFPAESDYGLPELLGAPHVPVRHRGAGAAALFAALAEAARGPEATSGLVLVADASGTDASGRGWGAAAAALELANGPGVRPLGHGGRRHAAHRPPDATAWSEAAISAAGLPSAGGRGAMQLVANQAPPVLLNVWSRQQPGFPWEASPAAPEGLGPAPSLPSVLALARLAERLEAGGSGLVATIVGEETHFLGVAHEGPIAWVPAPGPEPAEPLAAPPVQDADPATALSEGAYVPRARYLENLPSRWRFLAERCGACGSLTFPARGICRACRETERLLPEELPRSGTVLAATVVAPGAQPTEFDGFVSGAGGYGVVLVELTPGARVTLQVADRPGEAPKVGALVRTELRRLYPMEGEWRYGRKALATA